MSASLVPANTVDQGIQCDDDGRVEYIVNPPVIAFSNANHF